MPSRASRVFGAALLVGSMAALVATPATGQELAGATADDRKQAAKDFADGDRAFKEGDFRAAAEVVRAAYKPRPPPLGPLERGARVAPRRGAAARGQPLRAGTCARPPRARAIATARSKALNELSSKLAHLQIHATDVAVGEGRRRALAGVGACT